MKSSFKILYVTISILSLGLMLNFKSIPSGQLWRKYNVLYVQTDTPNDIVIKALDENYIEDYVCLSNQFLPVNLEENSPELSLLKLKVEDVYLTKRTAFFYDKSQNFRLYYIPSKYKNHLDRIVQLLSKQNYKAGVDTHSSYPWIVPFFVIVFSAILFVFAKNKWIYSISAVYSVIFAICNPFYSVISALILILIFVYFVSVLWKREGLVDFFKGKRIFLLMLSLSVLCIFCSSLITIAIFVIYVAGIYSSTKLYSILEDKKNSQKPFKPVLILPARKISLFSKKSQVILPASLAILAILIFYSVTAATINSSPVFSSIQLPGKTSTANSSENLPQFDEFYRWNWNLKTAPYKSINLNNSKENSDFEKVDFPYYENVDGKIVVKTRELTYGKDFKDDVYQQIDSLNFNSLEKVMKTEGEDFNCGYVSVNSSTINPAGIIMTIICFCILLFIYISSIIRKGYTQ